MKKLSDLMSDYGKVLESTPHYLSQYSSSDILRTLDAIDAILEFIDPKSEFIDPKSESTKESNETNLDFEHLIFFKVRLLARLRTIKENQDQDNKQLSLWE